MIRKIFILLFVSILLAGCISGEPAEKGTLQLTSSPTGAEIYLDNQYQGDHPGTISGVEPGNHTLEFRLKGYKSWKSVDHGIFGDTRIILQPCSVIPVRGRKRTYPAATAATDRSDGPGQQGHG